MTLRHSRGREPTHRIRTPIVVEVHPAHAHHVAVETHQEADLLGRTLPVLGGEGIEAEPLDPEFDCAADDVDHHRLARLVPLGAAQPALGGPAAIAVHHDGDVIGQPVGRNPRRRRLRRVLRRPARAAVRETAAAPGRRPATSICRERSDSPRARRAVAGSPWTSACARSLATGLILPDQRGTLIGDSAIDPIACAPPAARF